MPKVDDPPLTPFTDQRTEVLVVPLTVALNCFDVPVVSDVEVGVIEIETGVGLAETVTAAFAYFVESAALVALTVIVPVGTVEGAR